MASSNKLSRRLFLKRSLQGLSALGLTGLSFPNVGEAQAGPGKVCLVVQLLGGIDPLLFLPYTSQYADLATIRGDYARVNPGASPLEIRPGLALHPKLAKLSPYLSRTKVILHTGNAFHLSANRSHEVASLRMAIGGSPEELGRMGWMGRLYDQNKAANLVGFGGVEESFACQKCEVPPIVASSYEELDISKANLQEPLGGTRNVKLIEETMRELSQAPGLSEMDNYFRRSQRGMLGAIDDIRKTLSYTTPNFNAYTAQPAATEFMYGAGNTGELNYLISQHLKLMAKFKNAAQTIQEMKTKNSNERLVMVLPQGGHDIHDNWQKVGHNNVSSLAMGLKAFLDDMNAMGMLDNVVVFITSEFGRTIYGNGTGTDHGIGYPSFIIGGKVQGGGSKIVYGDPMTVSRLASFGSANGNAWPREVAQERLIVEIIQKHLGLDPTLAFPAEFLAKIPKPSDLNIFA